MNLNRPARRRWWILAAVLLTGSLAGFGHVLSVSLHGQSSPTDVTASERAATRTIWAFGYVDVESQIRRLNPTVPGRVAEVLVHEGDTVAAGAVLLRLEDTQARKKYAEAQVALEAAKAQLEEGRSLPEDHRIALQVAQAAIKAAEAQRNMAQESLAKQQRYQKNGLINPTDLAIAQQQLEAAEQAVRIKQDALRQLKLKDPLTAVKLLQMKVEQAELLLQQAKDALDQYTVTAPTAGTVLRVTVSPGDTLTGLVRQPAMELCPEGPRVVRAEVEQAWASLVAEGQEARVEDDTHAAGAWTGRVKRVADWFAQQQPVMGEPTQYNDVRTLKCVIELDPGQPKLRLNQRVRVAIQVPGR